MKKKYYAPIAKKIDYTYQEQVVAQSPGNVPVEGFLDPWNTHVVCTWGWTDCSLVYNVPTKARGLNDCENQGNIPLG